LLARQIDLSVAAGIPNFKLRRIKTQSLPNIDQRTENIRTFRANWRHRSEDCPGTEKRLEIRSVRRWKMLDDRLSKALLISNPLEQLPLWWVGSRWISLGRFRWKRSIIRKRKLNQRVRRSRIFHFGILS